jgi:ADP-ribose pyrophosphatase
MQLWKTRARKTILNHSKFLTVEDHTVELPDGRVIENWPWLIMPDYVNVVAITDDARFVCFRQTKYGIAGVSLAPIGGYIEPGEDPRATAQRELLEETGYLAREWISLGVFRNDGNRGCGIANLFLARGAHRVQERRADDLEEQELLLLTRDQVARALRDGEFKIASWALAIALALLQLDE